MASVKANAYGHGMVAVARQLQASGADMLGVARYEEGIVLRHAGLKEIPILIYGYSPPEAVRELLDSGLMASVYSLASARALSSAAELLGGKIKVHLKIDTGMGRLGLLAAWVYARRAQISTILRRSSRSWRLSGVDVEGIYTHFASADAQDKVDANRQMACFTDILDRLAAKGISFALRHAANSAAAMEMPQSYLDMIRPGLALYGLYPFAPPGRHHPALIPAMTLKARIVLVKEVPAGFKVSYGGEHVTDYPTRIATIPVGYADGYRRELSCRGQMLVAGCRAPVVGRVCMDLTMLDVGHIPGAEVGSEVVILGSQGSDTISADEIADWLGTINYEVVAAIMARVPRVYI